ncbi:hypothetical protein TRAPUB_881 [Trametes pubescens]|uniref:HAT C-terminal dimerisation domain-containing protein n=1 Tax=Trametes pubescens TaxID=154538 RepID=A0A1M2VKT5_TRAPU|nr:hypothetical protein TRAPUB_881 [Trametes pubescens]
MEHLDHSDIPFPPSTPLHFSGPHTAYHPPDHDTTYPLDNANSSVINSNGKRTRTASNRGAATRGRGGGPANKRRSRASAPAQTNADFPLTGVHAPLGTATGPSASTHPAQATPTQTAPMKHYGSVLKDRNPESASAPATDVWWFVYALDTKDDPPAASTPTIRTHLRTYHRDEWRDTVLANELKGWQKLAVKGADDPSLMPGLNAPRPEPFTKAGLDMKLADLIAADDHAIQIVESVWFRTLLIYVSTSPWALTDADIPRRTHMHGLLIKKYAAEIQRVREELKYALGRISFTTDLWSCRILRGFLAITIHFCRHDGEGCLVLRTRLGAFRHIPGCHTGANLASHFLDVLDELEVTTRVGCIALDNASNCGTMLQELEVLLRARNIPFDRNGNRIRCFPHVVNISVQHGLTALTDVEDEQEPISRAPLEANAGWGNDGDFVPTPLDREYEEFTNVDLQMDSAYADALRSDAVKAARQLVAACRASGQHREEFTATIVEGNRKGTFGADTKLRVVQLLRDVDTRWSSTFLMIDRLLELYPAIQVFVGQPKQEDITHLLLSDTQLQVLQDIREFLHAPHSVQELLSAEQTPTISQALPAYKRLLTLLELAASSFPKISHAIQASIVALRQYVHALHSTEPRVCSSDELVLNPSIKFSYLAAHWEPEEQATAMTWMKEAMLEYRQAERATPVHAFEAARDHRAASAQSGVLSVGTSTPSRQSSSSSMYSNPPQSHPNSRASHAQSRGFDAVEEVERKLRAKAVVVVAALTAAPASTAALPTSAQTTLSHEAHQERDEERVQRLRQEDDAAVKAELEQYKRDMLEDQRVDLLNFWQVCHHLTYMRQGLTFSQARAKAYPYMYRVALDILPVPASSVPGERVFSSSKETDTLRRTGLDAAMMEILQVLKYSLKQMLRERLPKDAGLVARAEDFRPLV